MTQPHNDYLRILYEFGVIGLTTFLGAVFFQIVSLRQIIWHDRDHDNTAATASYLGIVAWMFLSISDNGVIYGLSFMNPLFALIGAAYGLHRTYHDRNRGKGIARVQNPR